MLLSSGGDIALTFTSEAAFITGLGLFLCAHLCYVVAFLRQPKYSLFRVIGAIAAYGTFLIAYKILTPPADQQIAVGLYTLAISTMIAATILGTAHRLSLGVAGALIFTISDFIIAFTKFNVPSNQHLIVMITYYSAQILLHQSKTWNDVPSTKAAKRS